MKNNLGDADSIDVQTKTGVYERRNDWLVIVGEKDTTARVANPEKK